MFLKFVLKDKAAQTGFMNTINSSKQTNKKQYNKGSICSNMQTQVNRYFLETGRDLHVLEGVSLNAGNTNQNNAKKGVL